MSDSEDTLVMVGRSIRWWFLPVSLTGLWAVALPASAQILDRLGRGSFGPGLGQETVVAVEGQFTVAAAGNPAGLFVTAKMAPGWHIYSLTQAPGGPIPSKIKLDTSIAYRLRGPFRALSAPEKKQEGIWSDPALVTETHAGSVTWYAPIELASGVDPATLRITGQLYAQACSTGCLMPQDYPFTAVLGKGMPVPEAGTPRGSPDAAGIPPSYPPLNLGELLLKIVFGFLGGLILNLMPCVLPVISLKLLSFVDQAGESRGRVLTLNIWYTLGLLSVFMVLASLAAGIGLGTSFGWGQQFTLPWFKVAMTGLVFVMALSFLGVWEIPIPGFVGRGRAGELQAKEGASGAFFKGVFATILATPCSAPLLGPVFGYLLKQPPLVVYLVFGAVGLGMASPYLLVGAYPTLIRFLPKPGAWMETFKELMAFLLLGTVVYLLSTVTRAYLIPTLTLLVGLWFACWLIGRTPLTAGLQGRLAAWAGGILGAAAVGLFAFTVLFWEPVIPWRPFSPDALAKARAEGRTVMVDFTADWCPNCKFNSRFAIEKRAVLALVEKNGVVPLLADWTDESPAIKKALNDLGANSIPLLAVWPPEGEAIVLKDVVTEGQVIEALTKAGPSRPRTGENEGAVALNPD
jgi:cytochrome c biogenesis protein CcdA/thiol-disulfide isomerase/thioredoxin